MPDTEWLSSWSAVHGREFFCLWKAPGEDAIRTALGEEIMQISPVDRVYEVVDVDPDYFAPG